MTAFSDLERPRHADVAYEALPGTSDSNEDGLADPSGGYRHERMQPRGLPKLQMLAYAGIRSSERGHTISISEFWSNHRAKSLLLSAFMFMVIIPFINELIVEYGIAHDAKSTGYAAGILEAVVWVASSAMMMPWIYIADTYGRRPVLLGTTLICTVMGLLTGFPKSLSALLVLRFLAGFWNGQAAVSKTYLAELVDDDDQAAAFAMQGLAWQVGWSIAAIAGGYLSHAERTFPALAKSSFIKEYPYALGPLVSAIIPISSVIFGYFVMQETLPPGGYRSHLKMTRDMWSVLSIWTAMVTCNYSFLSVLPLFMFAPVSAGGMALGTIAIGRYFVARAVIIICVEFPIYPGLHKRFGHNTMLKGQILMYPLLFILFPMTSISRRYYGGEHLQPITMALLSLIALVESLAQTVFISGDLLVTNAAPDKSVQSKYNAMIEGVAKVGQLILFWFASWLFAFSAETQIFWGYLIWIVLFANSVWGAVRCFRLKEMEGWRSKQGLVIESPMTPMTPYRASNG